MNNIKVVVLNESHQKPANLMMFLATLTQSGHKLHSADDIVDFYDNAMNKKYKTAENVAKLPHGTINRFAPVTLAIVGASRRFLSQIRTHHIGVEWVSASLQYSDYSNDAAFVVPYAVIEANHKWEQQKPRDTIKGPIENYNTLCRNYLKNYVEAAKEFDNDTAGYLMPQCLRNVLIATANREAWFNILRMRLCRRNTTETRYVCALIWEALLNTADGDMLYKYAGPTCMQSPCLEGHMSCKRPISPSIYDTENPARTLINQEWPLLVKEE